MTNIPAAKVLSADAEATLRSKLAATFIAFQTINYRLENKAAIDRLLVPARNMFSAAGEALALLESAKHMPGWDLAEVLPESLRDRAQTAVEATTRTSKAAPSD